MFKVLNTTFAILLTVVASNPPNFLLIIGDDCKYTTDWDHSYSSLGINLSGETVTYLDVNTPNIQQFINDGSIIIPRSYAHPKCAPSRYAVITGRNPSRNEYARQRTEQTGIEEYGTRVTVPFSKMTGYDSAFNVASMLQSNVENPYYTGMIGKWHMNTNRDCRDLTTTPNHITYEACVEETKANGFDFVGAYYEGNIGINSPIGHNPEWKVQQAQNFIDIAVAEEKPFFMYFAFTLTHSGAPSLAHTLTTLSAAQTTNGTLTDADIPNPTDIGMNTRAEIYDMAISQCDIYSQSSSDWEKCAGTIWIDNAFGALINHLKSNNQYDNTVIVYMHDHGQPAKDTLFEQGTRIAQFIRYPALFSQPHVVSENLITNEVDLAAVIFEIVNQHQTHSVVNDSYILDGESWISDVVNDIESGTSSNSQICCNETYVDIEQSHAIISNQYEYIWRARDTTANNVGKYADGSDLEQLYDLFTDPSQQNNVINDPSYHDIACYFKNKMISASSNYWCYQNVCNNPDNSMCAPTGTTMDPTTTPSSPTTPSPTTACIPDRELGCGSNIDCCSNRCNRNTGRCRIARRR
eukprot:459417_1